MADAIHIACPHCDAVNRVPTARLAEGGNCGRCKQPLFTRHPIELDAARFAAHAGRSDLPLVVDFWAAWCGPCKMMAPAFAAVAARIEPRARLAKVDTEAHPDLASQFAIRSIPTLVVFRNGREIARQSGAMNAGDLERWISAQL
jgi:thioredoxin 2